MTVRVTSQAASKRDLAAGSDGAELDRLDLLSDQNRSINVPDADILATAAAFNTRIQRRKKEQERALSAADQASRIRHGLMIRALVNIRKSLREVTRIDLGERFHFALGMDDAGGWPRITVRLNDALLPQADYPHLRVTAHDRQARAQIEIDYDAEQATEILSLTSESELKRLPAVLKKCVRSFLDLMGDIVLEAERTGESADADAELEGREIDDDIRGSSGGSLGISHDLFEEEAYPEDILDTLPSLEQVETLGMGSDIFDSIDSAKKR